jgi:hypothetical protein
MDVLAGLDNASNALLAISKSTNAHLIGLYWAGGEVDARWILRSKAPPHKVHAVEAFSALHSTMMDIRVTPEPDTGRLRVTFGGIPVMDSRKLYLVTLPAAGSGTVPDYGIVFSREDGLPAQLREIYVDIAPAGETTKCYCRCKSLSGGDEFVEAIDADLGILAQFM